MVNEIKKYISRYVVPFYFSYENNGYYTILEYFRNYKDLKNKELGLPGDCCWVEAGFWEKYKADNNKLAEMDIYAYFLNILKEHSEDDDRYETNLGTSLVLKSNGTFLNLQYKGISDEGYVGFRCNDLGILLFRNGIGFVWYDIEFSKMPDVQTYVKFQHDFKELVRPGKEFFVKKAGKDDYIEFCMGKWLADVINAEEFGIRFWAERELSEGRKQVPDKALLFQYLFVDKTNDEDRIDLAFRIANGYDYKYNSPKTLVDEVYEPFGNASFYISRTGLSYVVSNNDSNEQFFIDNFKNKFIRDYFFIYVLLLYETYSCAHYSRLLTRLPADPEAFEKDVKFVEYLDSLDNQINLFLVKSVYESVSNIQHQNGVYKYGKKVLAIEDDIKSLTIGLEALRGIERDKTKAIEEEKAREEQEKIDNKDRALNRGLVIFGFLVVISAALDAVTLVDWFTENMNNINFIHIVSLGAIGLLTLFMFIVLIINTHKK